MVGNAAPPPVPPMPGERLLIAALVAVIVIGLLFGGW